MQRESELEMARAFANRYERFLPAATRGPPAVTNPVQVRDAPTGGGRLPKAKGKC